MKPSERRDALKSLLTNDWYYFTSEHKYKRWQRVAKWIRQMVNIEPTIMQEVSKATFGDLGAWIEEGEGKVKACGCLVGTVALKMVEARNHFKAAVDGGNFDCTTNEFQESIAGKGGPAEAYEVVGALSRKAFVEDMQTEAATVGSFAASLKSFLTQETAVALIKDEIVRALKARANRIKRAKGK